MTVQITAKAIGIEQVKRKIRAADPAIRSFLAVAIFEEGLQLIRNSVPLVPVDTGRLKNSHYVAPPVMGVRNPEVEIGYGTKYAVFVHERTELRHDYGEAKFLEKPFNAMRTGYFNRLAKRVLFSIERGLRIATLPPSGGVPPKPANRGGRTA